MFLPLFFLVCLTLLGPCNCSTFPANLDLGFLAHFWNDSSVGYRIKGIGLERVILNGFSLGRGHEELCFWRGTSLGQCIKSPVSNLNTILGWCWHWPQCRTLMPMQKEMEEHWKMKPRKRFQGSAFHCVWRSNHGKENQQNARVLKT